MYPSPTNEKLPAALSFKLSEESRFVVCCANAQVDYTGGQKFSTFSDGQPVHIQLTLNFLEIKTMTLGNYEAIRAGGKGNLDDQSILDRQSRTGVYDDPPKGE